MCLLAAGGLLFAGGAQEVSVENADVETENETITVQDLTGRTVEIPAKITSIATPNVDAYRILVQLGAQDLMKGVPSKMYGSQFSKDDSIEIRVWPEAKNRTQVGGGPPNSEINLESFIQVNPDVIITWGQKGDAKAGERADDLQTKTGIPVIALNIYARGANMPAVDEAYMLMGKITGKEERARELLDYFNGEIAKLSARIADVPADKHPKVFFGSVSDLKASGFYPAIKYLNLNSLTDKTLYGKEIPKEQMIAWDPEAIFLHTPSQAYRPSLNLYYDDPVLKEISAARNRRIHRIKCTFMGWDIATGMVDTLLIAKHTYPETFADINIEEKANEILETFYSKPNLFAVLNAQSDLLPE